MAICLSRFLFCVATQCRICKGCHTVTTKLTNLRYLKTDELKALDCQLWQQVLFGIIAYK